MKLSELPTSKEPGVKRKQKSLPYANFLLLPSFFRWQLPYTKKHIYLADSLLVLDGLLFIFR